MNQEEADQDVVDEVIGHVVVSCLYFQCFSLSVIRLYVCF